MIETEVSVHDNYSIQFKTGFLTDKKPHDENVFKINTWIFVPNGVDINSATYSKDDFYKDVKRHIRLITPVYSLSEVLEEGRGPLPRLMKALSSIAEDPNNEEKTEYFGYQIKIFACIIKSALRRESETIIRNTSDEFSRILIARFVREIRAIAAEYRMVWGVLQQEKFTEKHRNLFSFGDDFLGNVIEQYSFNILRGIKYRGLGEPTKAQLTDLVTEEQEHKGNRRYPMLDPNDDERNSRIISQRNILKKFIESDLFLHVIKKKDGVVAEQVYYSIAAGLAMIVATIITNIATIRYGTYTTSLFVMIVIGYMLKDRVKDLARYYFLNSMSKRYFDSKLKLSIRKQEIGLLKESFDYVGEQKVPEEVMALRQRSPLFEAENKVYNEQIMLYRKSLALWKDEMEQYKEYRLSGVNDITRFGLLDFTKKMDNPERPLTILDNNSELHTFAGKRVYALYFVIHCKSDSYEYYKAYRVSLNRDGISDVSELN